MVVAAVGVIVVVVAVAVGLAPGRRGCKMDENRARPLAAAREGLLLVAEAPVVVAGGGRGDSTGVPLMMGVDDVDLDGGGSFTNVGLYTAVVEGGGFVVVADTAVAVDGDVVEEATVALVVAVALSEVDKSDGATDAVVVVFASLVAIVESSLA